MPSTLYITDLSPFGARLRLVSAFTGHALSEALPPGGSGSDAMKGISLFGKIPAIDTGERVLIESLALMEYLVDLAGGSPLRPEDIELRAVMRGIMMAHDSNVLTALWPMFLQLLSGQPDPAVVTAALQAGAEQYSVLTQLFDTGSDFAVGGRITLADLAIAPFALLLGRLYPMFAQQTPFAEQPRLARWWGAVGGAPEVTKVMAVMDEACARAFGGQQ